ncbi:hypothetical protein C8J56DRAFT_896013 [Mycena floridula]|nr:hypothetical protein C8J56DRAFT_896013 [Mycena floridula]
MSQPNPEGQFPHVGLTPIRLTFGSLAQARRCWLRWARPGQPSTLARHEETTIHQQALQRHRRELQAAEASGTQASSEASVPLSDPMSSLSQMGIENLLRSFSGIPPTASSYEPDDAASPEAPQFESSMPALFNLPFGESIELQSSPHRAEVQAITQALQNLWQNGPDNINSDDEMDDSECPIEEEPDDESSIYLGHQTTLILAGNVRRDVKYVIPYWTGGNITI